jgi:phage baseplate assembly protein W
MSIRKEFLGRGWAFPFGFDGATGSVALSEYEENIRQCITIILGTRPGERQMLPRFGCRIHELLFAPNTGSVSHLAEVHVTEALRLWEPRVEVTKVDAHTEPTGSLAVSIEYRIISTGAIEHMDHVVPT